MDLFSQEKLDLILPNAELIYVPKFFKKELADHYFDCINTETDWQHNDITVFGKTYNEPKLTALYSDTEQPYGYSNLIGSAKSLTNVFKSIKCKVEGLSNYNFNTFLTNLYRNGDDSSG